MKPSTPSSINIKTRAREQERVWSWLVWLLMIGGAMLRLYHLDVQSLWIDEGFQYYIASAPSFRGVLNRLMHPFVSTHPPLSYLINHVFLWAGDSDFCLRLPSALFGIGSMFVYYRLARKLLPSQAVFWAVLVFAISPFHVWYSQEARAYAQLLFLSLLSTLLLCQACEQPRLFRWGLYAGIVTAGMYTHILMAFGVMAQLLWVLLHHRQHLFSYCVSMAVAAFLFLPWALVHYLYLEARSQSIDAITGASWGALPYTFFAYAAGFSLGPSLAELHENRSLEFLLQFLPIIMGVGIIYAILLMTGLLAALQHWPRPALVLCLLGFGVPLIGATVPSLVTWPIFNVRYTINVYPYFCMLIGTALASGYRKNPVIGIVAVLAVLSVSTVSLSNYFANPRYAKEDVKSAVSFWRQSSKDIQLFSNAKSVVERYLDMAEKSRRIPFYDEVDFVTEVNHFFATQEVTFVYVLLVRDWHQVQENALRQVFIVQYEHSFPGVKLFRTYRP